MPEYLNRFKKETQEDIIKWANATKESCEDLDPQDVFLDPILSVIEWNDAALQQRRVMKANITNFIQRVNGVQPFTDTDAVTNVGAQSDSIFSIIDIRIAPKSQIAADIMAYLRRTYGQQPNVSLGKFYIIQAAKKNQFEIAEYREVF
ncbi:hypothetical protein F8M41_022998 [Gigaspora margarita]|uniref:Uncharacterized protein n=1 Tax=Gigaspora margarita TaxID=4874 RepID=A0A8H4AE59_GIGMA|nr:hypothetical protein F8M41_022998 [Gigaspora margarita]